MVVIAYLIGFYLATMVVQGRLYLYSIYAQLWWEKDRTSQHLLPAGEILHPLLPRFNPGKRFKAVLKTGPKRNPCKP